MNEKTKKYIAIAIVVIAIALIVAAFIFKDKKYEVSLVNLGTIQKVEISKNGYLTKPADPVREGYNFLGWYCNGKIYDFNEKVTSDLKLEARWEKQETTKNSDKKCNVIFKNEDGTEIKKIVVNEGQIILAKPGEPSKDGYNFIGWYIGDNEYDFAKPVSDDMTLVAKFEKIPDNVKTYKVTFNTDGGSTVATRTVEENKAVKKPTDPTKTG